MKTIDLWLDDVRHPAAYGRVGWKWVTTISEAKEALLQGNVRRASLDHDLGACDACMEKWGPTGEAWLERTGGVQMPHCYHVGTGTQLVLWMVETGCWPKEKPLVHSMNPDGRQRMQGLIDQHFPTPGAPNGAQT